MQQVFLKIDVSEKILLMFLDFLGNLLDSQLGPRTLSVRITLDLEK
jgi:hypothetical protein